MVKLSQRTLTAAKLACGAQRFGGVRCVRESILSTRKRGSSCRKYTCQLSYFFLIISTLISWRVAVPTTMVF